MVSKLMLFISLSLALGSPNISNVACMVCIILFLYQLLSRQSLRLLFLFYSCPFLKVNNIMCLIMNDLCFLFETNFLLLLLNNINL